MGCLAVDKVSELLYDTELWLLDISSEEIWLLQAYEN